MKKVKAYSYLRISTEAQMAGDGLRRQMEASKKYAENHGYELVETISDLGVSAFRGKNAKEGALANFLKAIEDGVVATGSVLIVESLDRLSRDGALNAFTQFTNILTKGISIVTLMDNQIYTEESVNKNQGQLFTSLGIMIRANEESLTKSVRLKEAWHKKRKNITTEKMTKMAPAWVELSEDRSEFIVRNKKSAETVRKIFTLCINGMGIYSITRHLNSHLKQYPPISDADGWNDSYVAKILKNPAVFGQFQPHKRMDGIRQPVGDPIESYYPEIIPEDRFLLAQSRMKERRVGSAGRKGKSYSNLFSNLMVCGGCGGTMILRSKGKPPKGDKYLRCQNSFTNRGCKRPGWRYNDFEAAFFGFIHEIDFSDVLNDDDSENKKANLEDRLLSRKEKRLTSSKNTR